MGRTLQDKRRFEHTRCFVEENNYTRIIISKAASSQCLRETRQIDFNLLCMHDEERTMLEEIIVIQQLLNSLRAHGSRAIWCGINAKYGLSIICSAIESALMFPIHLRKYLFYHHHTFVHYVFVNNGISQFHSAHPIMPRLDRSSQHMIGFQLIFPLIVIASR